MNCSKRKRTENRFCIQYNVRSRSNHCGYSILPKDAGWSCCSFSRKHWSKATVLSPVSLGFFFPFTLSLSQFSFIFSFILILFLFSCLPSHVVSLFPFLSSKLFPSTTFTGWGRGSGKFNLNAPTIKTLYL